MMRSKFIIHPAKDTIARRPDLVQRACVSKAPFIQPKLVSKVVNSFVDWKAAGISGCPSEVQAALVHLPGQEQSQNSALHSLGGGVNYESAPGQPSISIEADAFHGCVEEHGAAQAAYHNLFFQDSQGSVTSALDSSQGPGKTGQRVYLEELRMWHLLGSFEGEGW